MCSTVSQFDPPNKLGGHFQTKIVVSSMYAFRFLHKALLKNHEDMLSSEIHIHLIRMNDVSQKSDVVYGWPSYYACIAGTLKSSRSSESLDNTSASSVLRGWKPSFDRPSRSPRSRAFRSFFLLLAINLPENKRLEILSIVPFGMH